LSAVRGVLHFVQDFASGSHFASRRLNGSTWVRGGRQFQSARPANSILGVPFHLSCLSQSG